VGGALLGHEALVRAAGGRVLAAHYNIGVVVATSPRPGFALKLGSLDARLVSVRRRAHPKWQMRRCTPRTGPSCRNAPCAEQAPA